MDPELIIPESALRIYGSSLRYSIFKICLQFSIIKHLKFCFTELGNGSRVLVSPCVAGASHGALTERLLYAQHSEGTAIVQVKYK